MAEDFSGGMEAVMAQEYDASFFLGTNFLSMGYYFGPYFGSFIKNPYMSGNIFLFERIRQDKVVHEC
jgi:hypothetical protein